MLRVILTVSAVVIGASAAGLPVGHYYGESERKTSFIGLKVKSESSADFSWVIKLGSWDEHFDCKDVSYTMTGSTIAFPMSENPCIVAINSKLSIGQFDIGRALTMQFDSRTGSLYVNCAAVLLNYVSSLTLGDDEEVVVPKKVTKKEKATAKKAPVVEITATDEDEVVVPKKVTKKKASAKEAVDEKTPDVEIAATTQGPKKGKADKKKADKKKDAKKIKADKKVVKEATAERAIEVALDEAAAPVVPIVAQQEAVNAASTTTKSAVSGLMTGLAGLAVAAMML